MTYCLNLDCPRDKRQNPPGTKYCLNCGSKLLLKDLYAATEPLRDGGFGRTFRAVNHGKFEELCVIKQLSPPQEFQKKPAHFKKYVRLFEQEARRLYELKHPQIPQLISYFEEDGRLYLVQEFIDGNNLKDELAKYGAYSETKTRELLLDLLPLLSFVHDRNVIHRDIKPENVIRRNRDRKLVLIDFGVSKQVVAEAPTKTGTKLGTPGYAALEQRHGRAVPASDLYSLGVTCIRLLTSVMPYLDIYGDIHDDLYDPLEGRWLWREALPKGTKIGQDLSQILDKLIQEYVKDRYKSAAEVLEVIKPPIVLSGPEKLQQATVLSPSVPTQPVTDTPLVSVNLESEKGIDYSELERLLVAKKWRGADQETSVKMLEVMQQVSRGYLSEEDIRKFPAKDLETIDQLWVRHSHRRFGFSVQKGLWLKSGGKPGVYDATVWEKFGDRVGWRVNGEWVYYSELNFTSKAMPGHLPGGTVFGWEGGVLCGVLGLGGIWFLLSRRDL
ncbi:GUN4 domain-containing protein [Tychonema sp. LEGE 07203]|uniref:GUN4 domain-containing protein n=1 Tax=Tychonema sp. LEGE 07203 TaxID=1828671 RepID=UPI00187F9D17|nr:GUN4 domain-containing protein [Tychonema sp. LEGE 07203]MBE9093021.1 GUN4 domain-containing protein [Tychonema sp. LEGE 07203]